jgi:glyceraldehyde 3-phosphate dehydrogenase
LRYDSIHGDFQGSVTADPENNALIINGTTVHITANAPEDIDYTAYEIDNALIIDTGVFYQLKKPSRHLASKEHIKYY